jgi:hypothetical protein
MSGWLRVSRQIQHRFYPAAAIVNLRIVDIRVQMYTRMNLHKFFDVLLQTVDSNAYIAAAAILLRDEFSEIHTAVKIFISADYVFAGVVK